MATLADSCNLIPRSFYQRDPVVVARELIGCELRRVLPGASYLSGRIVETEAYRESDAASHSFTGLSERNAVMFGPPGRAYVYLIYGMYDCFNVVCGSRGVADAVLIRAVEPLVGVSQMWLNRYGESMPGDTGSPEDRGAALDAAALSGTARAAGTPLVSSSVSGAVSAQPPSRAVRNLTSGPGKVCMAFGIRREVHNGIDLTRRFTAVRPGVAGEGAGELDTVGRGADVTAAAGLGAAGDLRICRDDRPVGRVEATKRIGITKAADRLWRFVEVGNPFLSRPFREGS